MCQTYIKATTSLAGFLKFLLLCQKKSECNKMNLKLKNTLASCLGEILKLYFASVPSLNHASSWQQKQEIIHADKRHTDTLHSFQVRNLAFSISLFSSLLLEEIFVDLTLGYSCPLHDP